jgi:hypothetical protein
VLLSLAQSLQQHELPVGLDHFLPSLVDLDRQLCASLLKCLQSSGNRGLKTPSLQDPARIQRSWTMQGARVGRQPVELLLPLLGFHSQLVVGALGLSQRRPAPIPLGPAQLEQRLQSEAGVHVQRTSSPAVTG